MANHRTSPDIPPPIDIVFSCHICQASLADIYSAGASSSDFRDGRPDTKDTRVTSLWLTECMHLVCGKHLEGGGAPFHPQGERPEALCPVCVQEGRDTQPRKLFFVRGWQPGSYDDAIPFELFVCPPIPLDGPGPDNEALQFQYLSLCRYGKLLSKKKQQLVHEKHEAEKRAVEAEQRAVDATSAYMTLKQEYKELREKAVGLEKGHEDVAKWRQRTPQITHYLGLWPELIADNDRLRAQLRQIGYDVPRRDYSMEAREGADKAALRKQENEVRAGIEAQRKTMHTPAVDTGAPKSIANGQGRSSASSSPRKRKHSEYVDQVFEAGPENLIPSYRDSRDMMPPPAKPPHHYENPPPTPVRGEAPATREKHPLHAKSRRGAPSKSNVDNYEARKFQDNAPSDELHVRNVAEVSRVEVRPKEYYMSGARHKSPSIIGRPPTRSFHHYQDIRDGNGAVPEQVQNSNGLSQRRYGTQPNLPAPNSRKESSGRRNFYLQQANVDVSNEYVERGLNHEFPTSTGAQNTHGYSAPVLREFDRPEELFVREPVTPAPRRTGIPGPSHRPESVASPFFRQEHFDRRRTGLTSGIAGMSAAGQEAVPEPSREFRMAPPSGDWHEPRSINGLSFINEPRDRYNEPLYDGQGYRTNHFSPITRVEASNPYIGQARSVSQNQQGTFRHSGMSSSYDHHPGARAPPSGTWNPPLSTSAYAPSAYASQPPRAATREHGQGFMSGARSGAPVGPYRDPRMATSNQGYPGNAYSSTRGLFSAAGGRRSVRR